MSVYELIWYFRSSDLQWMSVDVRLGAFGNADVIDLERVDIELPTYT